MKSAIIIETVQEANYIIGLIKKNDKRFINIDIYSLNPNINACFHKEQISCIESSQKSDRVFYNVIMQKCEEIEKSIISNNNNKINTPPNYYTNSLFYYSRQIWRHLLWNTEFIHRCLSEKKYDGVFGFIYQKNHSESPWIEDDELYVGLLTQNYCTRKKINFMELSIDYDSVERKKSYLIIALKFLARIVGPLYFYFYKKIYIKDRILLVPSLAKTMDRLCCKIKEKNNITIASMSGSKFYFFSNNNKNFPIDFISPLSFFHPVFSKNKSTYVEYFNNFLKIIDNLDENIFCNNEINFKSILIYKIENDVRIFMSRMQKDSLAIRKMLKILKPSIVISQMGLGIYGALGYWSKHVKIPAILISHGSHVLHNEKYSMKEHDILANNILTSDYEELAVQSPLARRMALLKKNEKNVINIDPVIWGSIIDKAPKENGIINVVHAGTLKYRHQRRFIYETADEYLSAIMEIAKAVKKLENIRFTIKIRPQDYELNLNSLKFFINQISNNVIIETEKPFNEVLSKTDLLISFSSTTIEEALVNKIPVVLYGGNGRYSHIPLNPFKKGNEIQNPIIFINDKNLLNEYFIKLNKLTSSFHVSREKFDPYVFKDHESIPALDLISNRIKEFITA